MDNFEIIKSIETNLYEFYLEICSENSIYVFDNKEYCLTKSKKFLWPDFIFKKNIEQNISNEEIEEIIKWKKEFVNTKLIFNHLNIKNRERDLKTIGLMPINKWIGMYLKTDSFERDSKIEDFEIEICKKEELYEFYDILKTEVLKNDTLNFELIDKLYSKKNFELWVGKYKNKIVSTCVTFEKNNIVGIYFIATSKDFQKRGFGKKITNFVINQNTQKNKKEYVLHASKSGENIYKKLGFIEYSKIYLFTTI